VLGKTRRRNEVPKEGEELGTKFAWNVEMIMIGYMHASITFCCKSLKCPKHFRTLRNDIHIYVLQESMNIENFCCTSLNVQHNLEQWHQKTSDDRPGDSCFSTLCIRILNQFCKNHYIPRSIFRPKAGRLLISGVLLSHLSLPSQSDNLNHH
jgi:hypothetical protein